MDLADLQIRSNGKEIPIDASWWNDIRLVLLSLVGPSTIGNTQQNITGSATVEILGLIYDSSSIVDFEVKYTAVVGSTRQSGKIRCYFDSQWQIAHEAEDNIGLTFSIHATTGQVSAINNNVSALKLQWRSPQTFAIEV